MNDAHCRGRQSHAEHAEAGVWNWGVERGTQAQRQHATSICRVDDAVVPQSRGGVIRVALRFILSADGRLEGFLFLRAPAAALGLDAVAPHGGEHAGRLFTAHHADAGVGPHPQLTRAIGAAAHAVVARAEGASDDDGELGHLSASHRRDQLGAMTGDAFVLGLAADHEAGDVLQEQQRNAALAAQLDEVRALDRTVRKQDAVVRKNAYRHAVQMRKAAHQRGAEAGLELVELGTIHDAGDDLADVEGLARIGGNAAVQLAGRIQRLARRTQIHRRALGRAQARDDAASDVERMRIVARQMVGHARQPGVNVAAAQIFGAHLLASGGLHQRRAAEEDGALIGDDDRLVAHGRHVGAARGARAHDHRDLRNALGAQRRLVVENATEVVAVGKHLVLVG